ncbi:MAG: hypothetical protein NZ455_12390 [Bacteroidia bacterium]|nr:hypothetical protein [Bacteroidia bacterium]
MGVPLPTSRYARVGKVGVLRANGAAPHPLGKRLRACARGFAPC